MKTAESLENRVFVSLALAAAGTIGHFLTFGRTTANLDWLWIATFTVAAWIYSNSVRALIKIEEA